MNGADARELYQEIILDHNKRPRNFHSVADATQVSEGYNPLCGDRIKLYLKVNKNLIEDVGFEGSGCAISKASASIMTTMVKGKHPEEAKQLFEQFHRLVSGAGVSAEEIAEMGKLGVFSGVSEFPARVKCASLAWHTLKAALEARLKASHDAKPEPISTE